MAHISLCVPSFALGCSSAGSLSLIQVVEQVFVFKFVLLLTLAGGTNYVGVVLRPNVGRVSVSATKRIWLLQRLDDAQQLDIDGKKKLA